MTRVEQERLVGNYLRGELTAGQEQEFFIQVALDSDLRQTLKAFRVVENAIQKHRQAISTNHTESYNRLMVMLSASAPEPAALVGTSATGLLQGGVGALATKVFSWTSAIVASAALTIGAFVLGPVLNSTDETPVPQQEISIGRQGTSGPAFSADRETVSGTEGSAVDNARENDHDLSNEARSAVKKSSAPVDPGSIASGIQKNGIPQAAENRPLLSTQPDPVVSLLNQSPDGLATASVANAATKKGNVKIVVNSPIVVDPAKRDTIKFQVEVQKDGMKKK